MASSPGGLPPPTLTIPAGVLPTAAAFALPVGGTIIGRSAEADVQLKHAEISRRHARVEWDGGANCVLQDLGSRWGTKVNDALVTGETRVALKPGDRLQFGPVTAHYSLGPYASSDTDTFINPAASAAGRAAAGTNGDTPPGTDSPPRPRPGSAVSGPRVLVDEHETDVIALEGRPSVKFGRPGGEVDVVLSDPGISREHALVEPLPNGGFQVTDLRSRAGSLVNGRRFERHALVLGDQLQMGPFFFRYDGRALVRTTGRAGVEIDARRIRQQAGSLTILDDVSLRVERGQFAAILGPSGSGKSSLLDTLTGLHPAARGSVRYDGVDFYREYDRLRAVLGYVPQDDIVHRELTPAEALYFSARLRLPAGTPPGEIRTLVAQTLARLGLDARAGTPIHRLSGGERKRVSVGVELLARPAVLFLDEPTSGLDPAAEFKLMELLRHLADGGCTVVCATHVMENVYLADRLFIIVAGRLVFRGTAQETRDRFGVPKLTSLYERLAERAPADWQADYLRNQPPDADPLLGLTGNASAASVAAAPSSRSPELAGRAARFTRATTTQLAAVLPVLWQRQWAILRADPKNFLILLGQPLVIALLVAWVSDNTSLGLFFAYLSTLWFGCSNAAQEIVRETPVYRRERMVGLGRHPYLCSKFAWLGALTAGQGVFLYACLWAVRWWLYPDALPQRGLDGAAWCQLGSLVCTAFAAVGIGFAISALARSTMQAVMIVPLVLIPQILFSGLVVGTGEMSRTVYALTSTMPSYAAQTMMDVGAFWHRPINGDLYLRREKAREHLTDLLRRDLVGELPPERRGEARVLAKQAFAMGRTYNRADLAALAACKLLAWTLLGYAAAWWGLRRKERG